MRKELKVESRKAREKIMAISFKEKWTLLRQIRKDGISDKRNRICNHTDA
jgi:hypothetical protein